MAYYKTCPYCGARLDPGERCNCIKSKYAALTPEHKKMVNDKIEVLLAGQKNTAPSVASTRSGRAEYGLMTSVHSSIVAENKGVVK